VQINAARRWKTTRRTQHPRGIAAETPPRAVWPPAPCPHAASNVRTLTTFTRTRQMRCTSARGDTYVMKSATCAEQDDKQESMARSSQRSSAGWISCRGCEGMKGCMFAGESTSQRKSASGDVRTSAQSRPATCDASWSPTPTGSQITRTASAQSMRFAEESARDEWSVAGRA